MTLTPNARFHVGLVNRCWYKDMLQGTDVKNNEFIVISSKISISTSKAHILPTQFLQNEFDVNGADKFANRVSNQSPDEISKAISKKRKKIMVNAIENSNEDIYHELLGFFTSIQNRTSLQRVNNEVSNVGSNGCKIGIQNPVKRKSKGRPKTKRIANAFEKSDIKTSYKYKLCNKKGHNIQTCKKKGKSNLNADDR
ncbi:7390_t:CDS:2 [Gigaspora rosea]|nr:7390_t:CDS:2 [Gigaspora rosea]